MLIQKDCIEGMKELDADSINCIVTSPPYNKKGLLGNVKLGNQIWGKFNIDYDTYGDDMPEDEYQAWMVALLNECYRVIKPDGSIFFNHKPRRFKSCVNKWTISIGISSIKSKFRKTRYC